MTSKFTPGDTVRLNSDAEGAWPMTVAGVCYGGEVLLCWLDSKGEQQRMTIPPECLSVFQPRRIDYPKPQHAS